MNGSTQREHAVPLGDERAADAAWRCVDGTRCGNGFAARHITGDRTKSNKCKQRVDNGKDRQRREWPRGFRKRQSARRLPEQHRHVPTHRQDRAPELGERVHAEGRKSHAGIAECRRDNEAGEAEAGCKVE